MKVYIGVFAFLGLTLSSLAFVSQTETFTRKAIVPSSSLLFSSSILEKEDVVQDRLRLKLPPRENENLTELELEFRNLLEGILYTPDELEAITSPRLSAIFKGIHASYYEPDVYRAFEVLYEDYLPLRVAGRIVYRKLQSVMEESKVYRRQQMDQVLLNTSLSLKEIELCWSSYVKLAKGQTMDMKRIRTLIKENKGEIPQLQECFASINNTEKENTVLEFHELITILASSSNGEILKDPLEYLQLLLRVEEEHKQHSIHSINLDSSLTKKERRHELYNQRYTEMLQKFSEWKAFIPSGDSRRLDILKGCFTGSENPKVVEALRVIYTDYNALRLSGDWIFNVVQTIMNRRLKKLKS
mmetsp:Transcript_15768/g.23889  ORF Transcript_15768/g.23889 Transcript_15768/m.23889 type:complete len:357 (-) Transcript_15768:208-1278(-)